MIHPNLLDEVLKGYADTMLWANATCAVETCTAAREGSDCEHRNDADALYDLDDFTPEDQASMREDTDGMALSDPSDFFAYLERRSYDPTDGSAAQHFGHDFALTRNGHGAGFWDRGLGDLGDRLTDTAHAYGDAHVWVTEDSIGLE